MTAGGVFASQRDGSTLATTMKTMKKQKGLYAAAFPTSPLIRLNMARVMPQPGQGMPVSASKGQNTGTERTILSAGTIPVILMKTSMIRNPAKASAGFLGMR